LARTVNLPIVVLAQLSRGFEKERVKRLPNKSDLRESGAIEQEADALLLLWYGFKAQWADPPTRITAILDKHRGGATGKFDLRFVPEFTRFSDAEQSRDMYADVDRDPGFDSSALAPTIP
jgi:replicative DNA helicase